MAEGSDGAGGRCLECGAPLTAHRDEEPGESEQPGDTELLTPGEVAALFGVDPKTVTRWATAGKLRAQRTLGGHRRYHAEEVYALLDEHRPDRADQPEQGQATDDAGAGTATG